MKTEEVLRFERRWLSRPQHDGAKMRAVYDTFGVSLVRYYQALLVALNDRRAWELDPVTCRVVKTRMGHAVRARSQRVP